MSPEFITFTGADDHTDVAGMIELSAKYPIEWGILFSPSRQGTGRYPGGDAQSRFWWSGLRLSAHLCGAHSRTIMGGNDASHIPVDLGIGARVQVNHTQPIAQLVCGFANGWGTRGIAQSRDPLKFPRDTSIDWLYDRSGGRGEVPSAWPAHPGNGRLLGYAGGIGPMNIMGVIESIASAGRYWIDMESGVRTDDVFDLELCRRVCETVYSRDH